MAFNREQSLIMDEQENMKGSIESLDNIVANYLDKTNRQETRITDLQNEVAILKQHRVQADILLEVVKLRERVEALESSAHQ